AYIKRKEDGRVIIKSGSKAERLMRNVVIALTVLTIVGFLIFDYSGLELGKAITETGYNLKTMFLEPALSHFSWWEAFYQVGITIGLAFLATIIGAVISIFWPCLQLQIYPINGYRKLFVFLLPLFVRFRLYYGC